MLLCVGDVGAQFLVERRHPRDFDVQRTATFGVMGLVFIGPSLKTWYQILDKVVGTSGKTVAVKKVFLDQAFFAPILIFGFFSVLGVLQRKSVEDIKSKIEQDYVEVVKAGWMIWPAAQLVNFYFTPPQHRILFVNTVSLFWNTYLAYKTSKLVEPKKL